MIGKKKKEPHLVDPTHLLNRTKDLPSGPSCLVLLCPARSIPPRSGMSAVPVVYFQNGRSYDRWGYQKVGFSLSIFNFVQVRVRGSDGDEERCRVRLRV